MKSTVNIAGRGRQYVAPNTAIGNVSSAACISVAPRLRSRPYTSAYAATPSAMNATKSARYPIDASIAYIATWASHSWSVHSVPATLNEKMSCRGIPPPVTMYSPVRRCHQ